MPGFAQNVEFSEEAEALLGEEELVVGAAAKMGNEKIPDGLDPVAHLVFRGKSQKGNDLPHGIHGFTPFCPVRPEVRPWRPPRQARLSCAWGCERVREGSRWGSGSLGLVCVCAKPVALGAHGAFRLTQRRGLGATARLVVRVL